LAEIKIYLPEEVEAKFRKLSMETHGYGRGSISKAGTEAIERWISEKEEIDEEYSPPREAVRSMRGLLRHVEISSVDLQHEAPNLRARRHLGA
jgi:hypothetical protein